MSRLLRLMSVSVIYALLSPTVAYITIHLRTSQVHRPTEQLLRLFGVSWRHIARVNFVPGLTDFPQVRRGDCLRRCASCIWSLVWCKLPHSCGNPRSLGPQFWHASLSGNVYVQYVKSLWTIDTFCQLTSHTILTTEHQVDSLNMVTGQDWCRGLQREVRGRIGAQAGRLLS